MSSAKWHTVARQCASVDWKMAALLGLAIIGGLLSTDDLLRGALVDGLGMICMASLLEALCRHPATRIVTATPLATLWLPFLTADGSQLVAPIFTLGVALIVESRGRRVISAAEFPRPTLPWLLLLWSGELALSVDASGLLTLEAGRLATGLGGGVALLAALGRVVSQVGARTEVGHGPGDPSS